LAGVRRRLPESGAAAGAQLALASFAYRSDHSRSSLSAAMVAKMKLRALLTIDIDTEDFVSAADHQRRVQRILGEVKKDYPSASLELKERRPRPPALPLEADRSVRQHTGRLHAYSEG
jgi:hypothetical protein